MESVSIASSGGGEHPFILAMDMAQTKVSGSISPTVDQGGLLKTASRALAEKEEGEMPALGVAKKQSVGIDSLANKTLKLYLKEIAEKKLLKQGEEYALATRYRETKCLETRRELIERNLRLVVKIAKGYVNRGMPFLDLIEEGNVGLIGAIDRFKPELGFRISTYATQRIRQAITVALRDKNRVVRLPAHWMEKIIKMWGVSMELQKELHREPTDEEVAKQMGMTVHWVAKLKRDMKTPVSLDRPFGDDEDEVISSDMVIGEHLNAEDAMIANKAAPQAERLLRLLRPRERYILMLRMGMTYALTMGDIEAVLGIDEKRICEIESNIAATMQPPEGVLYDRSACGDWVEKVKLDDLDPHEIFVFCYRFGRWEGDKATLDEIRRTLCLSCERVRQIEADALERLRKYASDEDA